MTVPTLTCEHCESEIDVEKDTGCVVYDPSGATDVICAECRELAYNRLIEDWQWLRETTHRIKRGWRA